MLSIVLSEEDVWDPEIWMKHLAQSGNQPPALLMLFERVKDSWDELSLQSTAFLFLLLLLVVVVVAAAAAAFLISFQLQVLPF